MHTSLVVVALSGLLSVFAPPDSVAWQNDYHQARETVPTQNKPLAVFIASGANGYDKVSRDGTLSPEVQKALLDSYICVYVDSSTPSGQKLATDFAITGGTGLILSDRTGQKQAFYHSGDLSNVDLTTWLQRFADPNLVVSSTMTIATERLSMYPANGYYGTTFSSGSILFGNSCPGGT